jgi:tRNA wybutosine-synthesizing protein 1
MCKGLAQSLHKALLAPFSASSLNRNKNVLNLVDARDVDLWDQVLNISNPSTSKYTTPILMIILPTWTEGTEAPGASLIAALEEVASDWRVDPNHLKHKLKYAIFGVGSSAYDNATFCAPAKQLHKLFKKLGATPVNGLGMGDVESGDIQVTFDKWVEIMAENVRWNFDKNFPTLRRINAARPAKLSGNGGGEEKKEKETAGAKNAAKKNDKKKDCCGGKDNKSKEGDAAAEEDAPGGCGCDSESEGPSDVEGESDGEVGWGDSDYDEENGTDGYEKPGVEDLEDMGAAMKATPAEGDDAAKEMVTPKQAKALKKEGYKLIGTHSAVKLCRWTKHQLRGRGGCYKHSFYGITSYQCMEATPSLACANKCVFCWRHHKNPVGRTWRWKTDDPEEILTEAVKLHVAMIKETKGIPGVLEDRWKEAHTVRHCALSLVGEPIMYPRINELLQGLHDRNISTYLVTNGQHPDAIDTLIPVTQLYVSVDAPTPASLEAIDRPLFKDAWDRLRRSLQLVRKKRQRTVARLTIVKGWNSDEIDGYADLIALGQVSAISYLYPFFLFICAAAAPMHTLRR